MKNKLLMFIGVFIVTLTLFIGKVSAFSCKYYKEGNTSNIPDLVVQDIKNYNDFLLNAPDSSILENENGEIQDYFSQAGNYILFTKNKPDKFYLSLDDYETLLVFLSLYPGQHAYDLISSAPNDEDKCPKLLRYEKYTAGVNYTYMLIHTDDLDVDPKKPINLGEDFEAGVLDSIKAWLNQLFTVFSGDELISTKGYLISEKYKGTPVDELRDKYNCLTYSSYITAIENTANSSGCENNQEFNKLYQELKELCDYFRETQDYSEDGTTKAKQCSKACSNFKDDISDMCKLSPSSGCNSLGPKVVKWIYKVLKWVRYIIPVIIIILVILEYIKALASEDEKAMKDATSHMFLRLVIAALIFILPFILDFVLNIFNITELDVNNLFCQK